MSSKEEITQEIREIARKNYGPHITEIQWTRWGKHLYCSAKVGKMVKVRKHFIVKVKPKKGEINEIK